MSIQFPNEIWLMITSNLSFNDTFSLALTSKDNYNLITSNTFWWPKVKHLWPICDYDPIKMTFKMKEKRKNFCFDYFRRMMNRGEFLNNLITDIINEEDNEGIQKRLSEVYSHFKKYIPFLLRNTLHILEMRDASKLVYKSDFHHLQRLRSQKLDRIYVASNILESGKLLMAYKFYESINTNKIKNIDTEDVYLHLSLFDSRYHELLFIRHRVLNRVIKAYHSRLDPDTDLTEKVIFLINTLQDVIIETSRSYEVESEPFFHEPTLEDKSILRHYCGDSTSQINFNYVILEKLLNMLQIKGVKTNDYCAMVEAPGREPIFVMTNGRITYTRTFLDMPNILNRFHVKDNEYFYRIFRNFYGKSKSRMDTTKGLDSIYYHPAPNGDESLYMKRPDRNMFNVVTYGGFFNKSSWYMFKNLLDDLLIIKDTYNQYILKQMGHKTIQTQISKFEPTTICSALDVDIGFVVWSPITETRGVVVGISDSESGDSIKAMNLAGQMVRFDGQPFYKVFSGPHGFSNVTREFFEPDDTNNVDELLAYDLIGKWFNKYDTKTHRFIYRHAEIMEVDS